MDIEELKDIKDSIGAVLQIWHLTSSKSVSNINIILRLVWI